MGIPHQAYLPVLAHHKICKLVTKLGFKLRPSGPNAFRKVRAGSKAKGKPSVHTSGRGLKK